MKPYGIQRRDLGEDDSRGAIDNGRATAVYARPAHGGDAPALRALRGGKNHGKNYL